LLSNSGPRHTIRAIEAAARRLGASQTFTLRLLGGFALEGEHGKSAVRLPQRRAEALLAMLAIAGDLGRTRDHIIALLWPESDEVHARHNLRDALHAIRHALGPDAVLSSGDLLRLIPSVVGSDVHGFSEALRGGRHADAVQTYAGPLLDGFHLDDAPEFERWLETERARLARRCAEALTYLGAAAEGIGAWGEAAGWWAQALEHDPLNSHLVVRHAEALAAMGDRANALKAADAHVGRLRRELDLEPDREVLLRIDRIRRGELPTPPGGAVHRAPTPHGDRPQTADASIQHLEPAATTSSATASKTAPSSALNRVPRWVPLAGAMAAVAILALVAMEVLRTRPLLVMASDIVQVTKDPGVEFQPAISPDGSEVAYLAGPIGLPSLFVRSTANLAGGVAVRLGDTALGSEWLPAWSPDGQIVRFWSCPGTEGLAQASCQWRETEKLGGAVRPVTWLPRGGKQWLAWSPDGARVAFVAGDTIFLASTADETPRRITVHSTKFWSLHSLAWSPDGKLIAYVNGNHYWLNSGNVAGSSIWIVSPDGGQPQPVTTEDHLNVSPAWLDARHLLFVSNRDGPRAAYVVEVGPNGRRGEPRILPGVADPHSISYSISARKLAFAKFALRQNIWAYPLGRPTAVSIHDGRPVTTGSQVIEVSDVSPDGRWLAFDSNRRGNMDLYKMRLAGGEAVPLTALPGDEYNPRWSPDGREIAFYATIPRSRGNVQVMVMPAAGGAPSALTNSLGFNDFPSWSPSGLAIAFNSSRTGPFQVWLLSRDSVGGGWHEAVHLSDLGGGPPVWAPDGSGVLRLTAQDLVLISPQGRVVWRRNLVPTSGLARVFGWPNYARDGRTIFVSGDHRDGRSGIWAIPEAGGAPRLVIAFDDPALSSPGYFSVDRNHLYLIVSQYESDIWVANLHW